MCFFNKALIYGLMVATQGATPACRLSMACQGWPLLLPFALLEGKDGCREPQVVVKSLLLMVVMWHFLVLS